MQVLNPQWPDAVILRRRQVTALRRQVRASSRCQHRRAFRENLNQDPRTRVAKVTPTGALAQTLLACGQMALVGVLVLGLLLGILLLVSCRRLPVKWVDCGGPKFCQGQPQMRSTLQSPGFLTDHRMETCAAALETLARVQQTCQTHGGQRPKAWDQRAESTTATQTRMHPSTHSCNL